jgi:hypothetical protein
MRDHFTLHVNSGMNNLILIKFNIEEFYEKNCGTTSIFI